MWENDTNKINKRVIWKKEGRMCVCCVCTCMHVPVHVHRDKGKSVPSTETASVKALRWAHTWLAGALMEKHKAMWQEQNEQRGEWQEL